VWLCRIIGHEGYLRELSRIDESRSEYVCRRCGWQGARNRPSDKIRAHF
jgi:hypothetical protein